MLFILSQREKMTWMRQFTSQSQVFVVHDVDVHEVNIVRRQWVQAVIMF